MKKNFLIILITLLLHTCAGDKKEVQNNELSKDLISTISFGKEIAANNAIPIDSVFKDFEHLKISDSLNTKVTAKVNSVCKAKGCWMKLKMENEEVMVKFKDYGFFMPKDIEGKEVVVNGKAYIKEISVKEQRHYAKDAGKTEEELKAITNPKRTYMFEADGVLLK